jgi:hypothetical protein
VFPKPLVQALAGSQTRLFEAMQNTLLQQQQGPEVVENTQFASRSSNRFEVRLPLSEPFTHADFYANRFVLTMAKSVLNNHLELDTFSHITSLPGAVAQQWHSDVGNIFTRLVSL